MPRIAISVLSVDFSHLREGLELVEVSGADWIHLDVMDHKFVPNISLSFKEIREIHDNTSLPLDAHLMVEDPEKYIGFLEEIDVKNITFHIEATKRPQQMIEAIHSKGIGAGICVNAQTPVQEVFSFLEKIDLVLVMSVQAGFGGQSFKPEALEKVRALKEKKEELKAEFEIQIDGGINRETAPKAVSAGTENLVCGSAFFKDSDKKEMVSFFKSLE